MSIPRKRLRRKLKKSSRNHRRIHFSLFLLIMICITLVTVSLDRADARDHNEWNEPAEIIVVGGDTLWSIAQSIPGSENVDIRQIIYAIKKVNGLASSSIIPGQVLIIPSSI